MNKLIAVAFFLSLAGGIAQAMPVAPDQNASSMIINVAGGCGLAGHRGPYGGCRANGREVVILPRAVIVAPAGPCGGRGQHRVYGVGGRSVLVCN